ncbi:MAG TPA: copper chaperone PCu(A)C [Vicinamibacterales bacterium]|nr:copper chaperone PCu(A)C [Vicinamibacterales bacterium]
MNPPTLSRILFALVLAATGVLHAQTSTVTVHDAWVREPMGSRNMTGAFAIVENTGATPRAIVAASADISDKVELHEMKNEGGMMRMSPVPRIDVPAHGRLELKPGSFHVMLFDLKRKPAPGDTVRLTLTLDDGTTVSAEATVRRPGESR